MSISCSFANSTSLSNSMTPILTHSATSAIPAFPGAQYSFSTFGLCASFHAIACSLPPPPTIRIFIKFCPPLYSSSILKHQRQTGISPACPFFFIPFHWQSCQSPLAESPTLPAPSLCAAEPPEYHFPALLLPSAE